MGWAIETVNDLLLWAHVEFGLWVLGAGVDSKEGLYTRYILQYVYVSKYFLAPIQGV